MLVSDVVLRTSSSILAQENTPRSEWYYLKSKPTYPLQFQQKKPSLASNPFLSICIAWTMHSIICLWQNLSLSHFTKDIMCVQVFVDRLWTTSLFHISFILENSLRSSEKLILGCAYTILASYSWFEIISIFSQKKSLKLILFAKTKSQTFFRRTEKKSRVPYICQLRTNVQSQWLYLLATNCLTTLQNRHTVL